MDFLLFKAGFHSFSEVPITSILGDQIVSVRLFGLKYIDDLEDVCRIPFLVMIR